MKITLSQFAIDAASTADTPQPAAALRVGVNTMTGEDARRLCLCLEDAAPHIMDGRARRALENKVAEIERRLA